MAESYKIAWLGFNEATNYNSIWGHIHMADNRDYVFWGIRGKIILFKQHTGSNYKIPYIISQKERKGYHKIHPSHYEMIYPKFKEDLEIWFMAHILQEE